MIRHKRRLVIMIPTLNEEIAIGAVIDEIPLDKLSEMGFESVVVVVDGKSEDRTQEIATFKNAMVFTQDGKGKGVGVRQAFRLSDPKQVVHSALTPKNGINDTIRLLSAFLDSEYVVMLDGDGTYPSYHIPDIVEKMEEGYEVVMGSRFKGCVEPGAMSRVNWVGNYMLCGLATLMYSKKTSDLCTGMWGFKTSALRTLSLDSCGFDLEAEIFAESAKNRFRIGEVPITYRCRRGESKLVPINAGLMIALKLIVRRVMNPGPDNRIMMPEDAPSSPFGSDSRGY